MVRKTAIDPGMPPDRPVVKRIDENVLAVAVKPRDELPCRIDDNRPLSLRTDLREQMIEAGTFSRACRPANHHVLRLGVQA